MPIQHPTPQQDEPVAPDRYIAETDLALYAAITGKKPTVEIMSGPRSSGPIGYVLPDAAVGLRRFLLAHRDRRIAVWMHHVSHRAWKHIDQARLRLAS